MKLIFAGTPPFAALALEAILDAGNEVVCVLTQPDRPAGRRLQLQASAVKRTAEFRGLRLLQPESLRNPSVHDQLRDFSADVMVVAAYGLILPQQVLDAPRLGALNIHASLLPRWRGAAPIQRALLAGDAETGITIMRMDAGLDTGAILLQEGLPIGDEDDAGRLQEQLARIGARLILVALERLERGELPAYAQPSDGVTYAPKISKAEARIDWRRSARLVCRMINAFSPVPGALASIGGVEIKVWRARVSPSGQIDQPKPVSPGEILSVTGDAVAVACGDGILELIELQRSGGKRLRVREFVTGFALAPGARFES